MVILLQVRLCSGGANGICSRSARLGQDCNEEEISGTLAYESGVKGRRAVRSLCVRLRSDYR